MNGKKENWMRRGRITRALLCVMAAGLQAGLSVEEVSKFNGGGGAWHLATLATANLDSSPDLEIIVPFRDGTGNWFLDAFKYTGQRMPGFPYAAGGEPLNVSPTIADLDGDGRDEIIITRANSVVALRANASVLWSTSVDSENYVPNGGFHTVTNGFYWSAGGVFRSRLPSTAVFSSEVSPPLVADLDGNGTSEVLTAWKIDPDPNSGAQDYNPHISKTYGSGEWGLMGETWSGSVISFDAETGARTFVYHLHQLVESGLAVGRAAPAGPLHVYELTDSDSVVAFDKSRPFGLWGKGMLHKQFGKNQRLMTGSYQYPVDIQAADIDGDGLDEVLVPGTQASTLWQPNDTILDDDGTILCRNWLSHVDVPNNMGWLNSASLIACNPDHDNRADVLGWNHGYEITFRTWNGAEFVDRPGWPKSFYPFVPTPPVVGDVDGDGAEEIIVGTCHPANPTAAGALNVYALDGTLEAAIPVQGGIKQIPALADVRGIGRLDIIYRTTLGLIVVQNLGGFATNAVSWATHRGNMRRNGNFGRSLYRPGTPLITSKESGCNRSTFAWTNTAQPRFYRVYRSENAEGPFVKIATLMGNARSYTDTGLASGVLYYYEIAADFGTHEVRSAPFTGFPLLNGNLLVNSGFEACENSHWDKWFTGSLGMTNMAGCASEAYQGKRSMELHLKAQSSGGSVAQFNQYGIPDSTIYVTPGAYYSFGGFIRSGGLTQPSAHWLEWGSAKTGYDTNTRPARPWPSFFTPYVHFGTAPSGWTYMNRTFRLPQGFPNLEVYHRFDTDAPASGSVFLDNLFFRRIPSPEDANWTSLVSFGAEWRFSADTPPSGWSGLNFDDRVWTSGRAKFGAGSGPTNITTRLPGFRPAYFFRTRFEVPSGRIEELLLSATCTDDYGTKLYPLQFFLNGVQIESTLDVVTGQGNEVRHFDLTPFAHLLHPGQNLVAIRVANGWSSWDDVAFDVSLKAVCTGESKQVSISCANPAAPVIAVKTEAGSIWKVESKDDPGGWQTVQTLTNTTGAAQTVTDLGQNGRVPPAQSKNRLYRVVPF